MVIAAPRVSTKLVVMIVGVAIAIAIACAGAYFAAGWWSAPINVPADPNVAARLPAPPAMPGRASDGLAQPLPGLPAAAMPSSRYQLNGVMAGTAVGGHSGVALIAVDGAAARAFRVGDAVDGELVLLGVTTGGASLGPPHGSPTVLLQVTSGAGSANVPQSPGPADATTGSVGTPLAAQAASERQHPGRRVRLQHQNLRP